ILRIYLFACYNLPIGHGPEGVRLLLLCYGNASPGNDWGSYPRGFFRRTG
ncbi:hypothetical protein AVEN_6840-1, partial [Araneus ventricosus]